MVEVYNFIDHLNLFNKNIVVATSGGPDSMLLLDILRELEKKYNYKIICAHVHHNIRKESDNEAVLLKNYCENNNIIFEMYKIEKYPNNKFSEENARKIRYNFFSDLIKKYNADVLFTAHHADDLTETILMRLIRGTSLKGYAGIKDISNDRGYKIARPLLCLTKNQIIDELEKREITYSIDKSNLSNDYTRNRFRNNVIPLLKEENNSLHKKIKKFSEKMIDIDNFISKIVDKEYFNVVSEKGINIIKLFELDKLIIDELINKYVKEIYKDNIIYINDKHINIIKNLLLCKNKYINLPLNKKGLVEFGYFSIVDTLEHKDYKVKFEDNLVLNNKYIFKCLDESNNKNNYIIYLNSKEITMPLYFRNRKNGDYIYVKNFSGKQKISDIFTNSKVSKKIRDSYPLLVDAAENIIWIPGIKKSKFDRQKSGKYDIIISCSLKEEIDE